MSDVHATFQDILKKGGYSLTTARKAVFEVLLHQEPLSMHELVKKASDVDRASVYRAVELFENLGIVLRLYTGWKYKLELTDTFSAHHHHLTCTRCDRTVSMNETELERFVEHISRGHGFILTGHQIELQGICANCARRAAGVATS